MNDSTLQMKDIKEYKRLLMEEVKIADKQIYDLETKYLEETANIGSLESKNREYYKRLGWILK